MLQNTEPKFPTPPLPPGTVHRIELSFSECSGLTERVVNCPYCGFPLVNAFSDACGHFRLKCRKCKASTVLNVRYFRRICGIARAKRRFYENHKKLHI